MRTHRIGLVGYGYWGPKYLRLLREHPETRPAFVVDVDSTRLKSLEEDGIPTFPDVEAALGSVPTDAVIVVTPATTHRKVVETCLRRGVKTLVEKPLTPSLKDSEALVRLSQELKVLLYPGHIYAHNDGVRALAARVKAKSFGGLRYVDSVRTGLGPVRGDVSALWDLVPHDLTIIESVGLRRPEEVVAMGNSFLRPGVEDVVFGTLRYPGGALANVQGSWLSPYKVRQTTVVGAQEMAIFDDMVNEDPLRLYGRGVEILPTTEYGVFKTQIRSGDVTLPYVALREPLRNLLEDFLAACRDPRLAQDELRRALEVVATLEAMERSMRAGGRLTKVDWSKVASLDSR